MDTLTSLQRLQRAQFAAASFVTGKYVNDISVILKLGWLPVKERRDWHLKAMYSPLWPSYLPIDIVKNTRNLRSSAAPRLTIPLVQGTFQDSASRLFNSLPSNIRACSNFKQFCNLSKEFLTNRACAEESPSH